MEIKKEITKELLAESFHSLLLSHDFDKITIKMITDEAGVIRPTFYYYFQDKYDLLSFILYKNVFLKVRELSTLDMDVECVKCIFISIEKDKKFYQRAFEVTGQNSFEHMFYHYCYELFFERVNHYTLRDLPNYRLLTNDVVAKYYTIGFVNIIKEWIQNTFDTSYKENPSAEDIFEAYEFLISHSIFDILKKD
ncbi:MAG: TetR/AcrR family transcriptional regulator C-terminal domain-containing protein [Velocimicrobium sp.]